MTPERKNITPCPMCGGTGYVLDKSVAIPYSRIIGHLNEVSGRRFHSEGGRGAANRELIHARWLEGWREEDFRQVVDNMARVWKGTDMESYLRPKTLFGATKMDDYWNRTPAAETRPPAMREFVDEENDNG